MLSSAVTDTISRDGLISFFRTKADEFVGNSSSYYRKALANFEAFLETQPNDIDFSSELTLADWVVYMYMRKLSFKTSMLYFNSIAALYGAAVKEGIVSETENFRKIKIRIKEFESGWNRAIDESGFSKVVSLTRRGYNARSVSDLATDMLLYSLLAGCIKLIEVAKLKKGAEDGVTELDSIVLRNVNARRKYVFNLQQSEYTPLQLERIVNGFVGDLIHAKNLPWAGNADDSIECYWVYAALRAGVTGSEIVGYLGHVPEGIPMLRLCSRQELTPERREEIMQIVGKIFVANSSRWYAMRLRPLVSFDELRSRIGTLYGEESPELFYPMEEIARRIKKKIVMEEQPVIRNVVFFRCGVADISLFMSQIADLAWCYTETGRPGAPYAAIPDSSMHLFQLAIGHYTSQYETAICNPEVGSSVKVMSGMFEGIEASLLNVESIGGNNIFQLLYTSDNNMRWKFGVDARQTGMRERKTRCGY